MFARSAPSWAINVCAHGRPILCADDTAEDANTDAAIRAMRVFAAYLDPEYTEYNFRERGSAIDIVSDWNDYDGRTVGEVIDALIDAAADWDRAHPAGGAR